MNLITRDPFFGNFFKDLYDIGGSKINSMMKTDIYEDGDNYVIETDIPGFKKDEIVVDYDEGYLTISAKKEKEEEQKEKTNYIKRERYYGEYSRSYYVGKIDESQISAKFEEGTLKIVFPKEQVNDSVKQIQID